jgi:predicted nucleic acid-binding protein
VDYYAVKVHYFDASALVKLVADDVDDEPGRDVLRKYHRAHAHPGYTTSFCIAEAFGALKSKFLRHKISQAEYLKFVKDLIRETGNTFKVDELPPGRFRIFDGPSTILITADRALAKAAREEGAKVWDCTSEPAPGHV